MQESGAANLLLFLPTNFDNPFLDFSARLPIPVADDAHGVYSCGQCIPLSDEGHTHVGGLLDFVSGSFLARHAAILPEQQNLAR